MDPHAAYSEADPIVAYRVADLLDRMGTRLDEGIATLLAKLDDKAGKADLAAITARLEEHGKKILAIEERLRVDEASAKAVQAQRDAWRDWRRWAIGLFACVAASAGAWVPLIK